VDIERTGTTSVIDVLDRVLDKGIVIDAWMRISLCGLDLMTIDTRVLVASIETYLKYSNLVAVTPAVASPGLAFTPQHS
jgi:hypothetical protein